MTADRIRPVLVVGKTYDAAAIRDAFPEEEGNVFVNWPDDDEPGFPDAWTSDRLTFDVVYRITLPRTLPNHDHPTPRELAAGAAREIAGVILDALEEPERSAVECRSWVTFRPDSFT